jgi:hypothetical protein
MGGKQVEIVCVRVSTQTKVWPDGEKERGKQPTIETKPRLTIRCEPLTRRNGRWGGRRGGWFGRVQVVVLGGGPSGTVVGRGVPLRATGYVDEM